MAAEAPSPWKRRLDRLVEGSSQETSHDDCLQLLRFRGGQSLNAGCKEAQGARILVA